MFLSAYICLYKLILVRLWRNLCGLSFVTDVIILESVSWIDQYKAMRMKFFPDMGRTRTLQAILRLHARRVKEINLPIIKYLQVY